MATNLNTSILKPKMIFYNLNNNNNSSTFSQ